MKADYKLFAGSANRDLTEAVARQLNIELGDCTIQRFPDGEVGVELNESVREQKVFILQSTSPPVDRNLIELLASIDACRRSSAADITAIVPYFGYARSDKRQGKRQAIVASLVANILQAAGSDRLITFDLHAPQIEGFFHIPVDSLTTVPILYEALSEELSPDTVVVSPDSGRVPMAMAFAQQLGTQVVVLHKQRASGTKTAVTHVIGDVRNRACLIVDDMISTGGTLATAIAALLQAGALPEITIAATHGLFVKNAREKLNHPSIKQIFITDSVSCQQHENWSQLKVVSLAPAIATAIEHTLAAPSLS